MVSTFLLPAHSVQLCDPSSRALRPNNHPPQRGGRTDGRSRNGAVQPCRRVYARSASGLQTQKRFPSETPAALPRPDGLAAESVSVRVPLRRCLPSGLITKSAQPRRAPKRRNDFGLYQPAGADPCRNISASSSFPVAGGTHLQEPILQQLNPANVLTKFKGVAQAGQQVVKTDVPQGIVGIS